VLAIPNGETRSIEHMHRTKGQNWEDTAIYGKDGEIDDNLKTDSSILFFLAYTLQMFDVTASL